jgi:tetratricopeptide (TPR) repeat protein
MAKNLSTIACIVLTVAFATGCKREPSAGPENSSQETASPSAYFQTPFQDESQFIVEAIVSDLAEQMYFAASHHLPDPNVFQVTATEKPGSPLDAPVYELQIRLDAKQSTLNSELNVNGPIWSPAVYKDVAKALAQQEGLTAGNQGASSDTSFLSGLTDGSPITIEQHNEDLSEALESDFKNPELHEEAAELLGTFLLRDHSGYFYEIRSPLCRLTAHLAMAQFLNGTNSFGINGKMAEATLLTLINDETAALDELKVIGTNDAAVAPMVRALWTRNTGDYRLLGQMNNLTPIESAEWFCALADYVSDSLAWPKLNDIQQRTIDYVRIANQGNFSVEMGHQLLAVSLSLEIREIENIYQMTHHKRLTKDSLISALNEMPERCFTTGSDGTTHVDIIGWGQWADFLQRHLCQAVQSDFDFLQYKWGVPDDAKEFAAKCDEQFGKLRFYPFVERFDCTEVNAYHKSVDDGFKVTVATPQLTPAYCWNEICWPVDFATPYQPNPNPHINEWHHHNPPPGTAYDLNARLYHPSLTDRSDVLAKFETLHDLAPYDCRLIAFILKHKYDSKPDYDQAASLFQNVLPYSLYAMRTVANTVRYQPDQYQKLMLQAAQLDPTCYYVLADFAINQQDDDRAAEYYEKGCDADPDSVRVANLALWRVKYYLKKGQTDKAREIADDAGEVYSYQGLEAQGTFYEMTSNYDEAFECYSNIDDRYNDNGPLMAFCLRHKTLTGNTRFDSELKDSLGKLFPNGIEKVSLADFHGPPTDGVLIQGQNSLLLSAGLRAGDVIVALGGNRTHTFAQYSYLRDAQSDPIMDLIVWQGDAYHEIRAVPPNHRFNVDFGDYQPR